MVSFWFIAKVLRRSLAPLARLPEEQARFLAWPWLRRFKKKTGDPVKGVVIHQQAIQVWSGNPMKHCSCQTKRSWWNNSSWCTSAFAALSKASQRRFGGSAATTASWRLLHTAALSVYYGCSDSAIMQANYVTNALCAHSFLVRYVLM